MSEKESFVIYSLDSHLNIEVDMDEMEKIIGRFNNETDLNPFYEMLCKNVYLAYQKTLSDYLSQSIPPSHPPKD